MIKTLAKAQQQERAEAALREALDASPGFGPAAIAFARLKVSRHDLPAATAILDDAIAKNPSEYDAITLRAELKLACVLRICSSNGRVAAHRNDARGCRTLGDR